MIDQEVMKRAQDYLGSNGLGQHGKYEGEPLDTIYYHLLQEGDYGFDFGDEYVEVYNVGPEEKKEFSLNKPYFAVSISDSGFVTGKELSIKEFRSLEEEYEDYVLENSDSEE